MKESEPKGLARVIGSQTFFYKLNEIPGSKKSKSWQH